VSKLQKFLEALAAAGFYGKVTLTFREGKVHGAINVQQDFIEETLPETMPKHGDPARPAIVAQPAKDAARGWMR
jgi:hypothetical protein